MISILRDIKNEYFYQYLIDCFNHSYKCKSYNEILQFLTLDDIYMIKYKDKEIINNFDLNLLIVFNKIKFKVNIVIYLFF